LLIKEVMMAAASSRGSRKVPTRGQELEDRVRAELDELGLVPDSREEEALKSAHVLADRMERLEATIVREGEIIRTSKGDLRTNPACSEHRATAISLNRILGGISMTPPAEPAKKNPVKQRAARTRWQHKAASS
jgi:hypothetical protein